MNSRTLRKGCFIILFAYLIISVSFYFIAHEQLTYRSVGTNIVQVPEQTPAGEIIQGIVLEQPFQSPAPILNSISFLTATYARENRGEMIFEIIDTVSDTVLHTSAINLADVPDNKVMTIILHDPVIDAHDKHLVLRITGLSSSGNAVTIWQRPAEADESVMLVNGQATDKIMCFATSGTVEFLFGKYYVYWTGGFGLLLAGYLLSLIYRHQRGMNSIAFHFISVVTKYQFLIHQLVSRDFKTKYKRSVLGVLWSFLNPLLVMLVQYVVFSTLFKSDIVNFPVYLLTGIVCFNYFNESTTMALTSIVGNATLITKVYVPKYIYPLSRILSSTINLLLSFIPLFLVIIIMRTQITIAYPLLIYGLICLVTFSLGMGMVLASAMVFFRDTQFLWNVLSMLWVYATPIFYPESIIPTRFSLVLKLNPMYHFIRFVRTIILGGVSPEPKAYLFCAVFAAAMLLIGVLVFKKTQDKFVLYI